MAKLEMKIKGNYQNFVDFISTRLKNSSLSASIEDQSFTRIGDVNLGVISFERYSGLGGNRVSLTLTVAANGDDLTIIGMTAGGSQAMFFKLNTVGENSFLNKLRDAIAEFVGQKK